MYSCYLKRWWISASCLPSSSSPGVLSGRYGKIVSVKHQHFSGRPNLLTESRILTMSLSKTIPAEVFVDAYPTRVWYSGMQPFCQICKTRGIKPPTVNTTENAENVVLLTIWLVLARPAGVGVFGELILFRPVLLPR